MDTRNLYATGAVLITSTAVAMTTLEEKKDEGGRNLKSQSNCGLDIAGGLFATPNDWCVVIALLAAPS